MASSGDRVLVKFHEKMQPGTLRRCLGCNDDDWWIVDLSMFSGVSVIAPERFIVIEIPASFDREINLCPIEERSK